MSQSGIWDLVFEFSGAIPAIHFNLLLFKGKSKRISVSIGAMAAVFRRKFRATEDFAPLCLCENHRKGKKIRFDELCETGFKKEDMVSSHGKTTQNRENPKRL